MEIANPARQAKATSWPPTFRREPGAGAGAIQVPGVSGRSLRQGPFTEVRDDPAARLHVGDDIKISFDGLPSDNQMPTLDKTINEDGTITLADIGAIKAAGLTTGELENAIQGAVILTDGDTIAKSDLPKHLQVDEDVCDAIINETFGELIQQFKIDLANKAVADCNGNKTLAARKLSVSRAYLHRLLRKLPDSIQGAA